MKWDLQSVAGAVALQVVVLVAVGWLVRSSPELRKLISGGGAGGCGCGG
jgi:hypothetical protein